MRFLKTAVLAIVSVIVISCGNNYGKVIYVGGADEGNDLVKLLNEERFKIKESATVSEALEAAKPESAVILVAGGYPGTPLELTEKDLGAIKEKGLKVFAEFAVAGPSTVRQAHDGASSGTGPSTSSGTGPA
jgi:hypothetical protein